MDLIQQLREAFEYAEYNCYEAMNGLTMCRKRLNPTILMNEGLSFNDQDIFITNCEGEKCHVKTHGRVIVRAQNAHATFGRMHGVPFTGAEYKDHLVAVSMFKNTDDPNFPNTVLLTMDQSGNFPL